MINSNKTYMKKIILNKDKVFKNEYFFIDNDSEIRKSSKIIFFIKFWIENKKTLKKKKHIGVILDSNQSIDLISLCTISVIMLSNDILGAQPNFSLAFEASPSK